MPGNIPNKPCFYNDSPERLEMYRIEQDAQAKAVELIIGKLGDDIWALRDLFKTMPIMNHIGHDIERRLDQAYKALPRTSKFRKGRVRR